MTNRKTASNLGIYAYAFAAIALGVIGFVWGDFASGWQRVPANLPGRTTFAYITALLEFGAGAALMWPRAARLGAAILTIVFSIFTLSWLAHALAVPRVYDSWGNVFEELSLVIAGLVLFSWLAPPESAWAEKRKLITRLYGICPISFGIVHVVYLSGTASYVPKRLPPGQVFWAVATAIFFFMAAASILSGVLAGLASRLLTIMIVVFELLIWLPMLFATPRNRFVWAGNGISLAMAGAAWVIADSLNAFSQRAYETSPVEDAIRSQA